MDSMTVYAIVLYSASVDDFDAVGCFLDFRGIRCEPNDIATPMVDSELSRRPTKLNI